MNNSNNNLELVSPSEAFNRGNLFDNYFWPYKYVSNVKVENERQSLMLELQKYAFSAHELNLYLDVYPNDMQAIGLYNQYTEMANNLTNEYETKYGPISVNITDKYPWQWINSPWPWEKL